MPRISIQAPCRVSDNKDKVGLGVWCRMLTCQPVFLGSAELLKDRSHHDFKVCAHTHLAQHEQHNITYRLHMYATPSTT